MTLMASRLAAGICGLFLMAGSATATAIMAKSSFRSAAEHFRVAADYDARSNGAPAWEYLQSVRNQENGQGSLDIAEGIGAITIGGMLVTGGGFLMAFGAKPKLFEPG